MMKPDIAGEPLQDRRQAQIGRALQGRGGRIPRVVTDPTCPFATVLHREQPDADDCCKNQNRQLHGGHALVAKRQAETAQGSDDRKRGQVHHAPFPPPGFRHVERQAVEQDEDEGGSRTLATSGCRTVRYRQRAPGFNARYSATVRQEE